MPSARSSAGSGPFARAREVGARQAAAYANGADRPLGGYLVIVAAYTAATASGVALVRRRDSKWQGSIPLRDAAVIAAATFQLARVVTKKPIASVFRAPFTQYEGTSGPAELEERVRGDGLRHAVGELLTCPFCMAHWIVTGFAFAYFASPDTTRLVATMLTAEAAADFLQYAHATVSERAAERQPSPRGRDGG
jgi:hypothetical protein